MKGYKVEIDNNKKEVWVSENDNFTKRDIELSRKHNSYPKWIYLHIPKKRLQKYIEHKKQEGYEIKDASCEEGEK
jgi:hypothetical protein